MIVQEQDKIPDTGTKIIYINAFDLSHTEENIFSIEVFVVENRERYSGNDSKWVITISMIKI